MDRRPVVLIVEDFDDAREMYAEFLALEGYEVVAAANGREALELVRTEHPELILMDLSMPVMNGYDASRAIKDDPATRHIPVVALSGHVMTRHRLAARDAGCETLVPKPCPPSELASKIRTMLHSSKASR